MTLSCSDGIDAMIVFTSDAVIDEVYCKFVPFIEQLTVLPILLGAYRTRIMVWVGISSVHMRETRPLLVTG